MQGLRVYGRIRATLFLPRSRAHHSNEKRKVEKVFLNP